MEEKKDKPAPVCACGKQSKHIVYSTFEYFFCEKCKLEVKEQEKPKRKNSWTATETLGVWDPNDLSAVNAALKKLYQSHGQVKLGGASGAAQGGAPPPAYGSATAKTPSGVSYHLPILPPGIVALKGEKIVCSVCDVVCAELLDDLAKKSFVRTPFYGSSGRSLGCVCPITTCVRHDLAYGCEEVHIEGRGWV